jgi:hypothetical protein
MVDYYIEYLNEDNALIWDEFNKNSEEGSFFHSLQWKKVIDNTSDINSKYYLLFKNDHIHGIFPFIERKIYFFTGLVPLQGFGHNNAILLDANNAPALQNAIQEINKHHQRISFISLSTLHERIIDNLRDYSIFPYEDNGNMMLDLRESPPERIWNNFSAKIGQRKYIRRFDEKGFKIVEVNSLDDLKLFYKYYKENINLIGGKPQSLSHFMYLWNLFSSDKMRITFLSKDSIIAGGLLMFADRPRNTLYFTYLSLNKNLPNTYHPTYPIFWEAINWAWDNKYNKISFGAQRFDTKSPRYRIKNQFGATFEPLYSRMLSLSNFFTLTFKCKQYTSGYKRRKVQV